ncbi:TPA: DUF2326 domain-containing protein [Vibrio parahaemolyticus]|uniref:DUF2326 domain-containing protein n=2 Tax=Vibrio parahaemolyticus TaxID=670 RepID=UPI001E48D8CC|nr:DUF2326 domain-containing protein [Vibrio parahaemolyticus]
MMKLIRLYSDNPAFKPITFKTGLNIVAGLQSSSLSKDSYNGIGKSSSLHLLHLMLGGSFDEKVSSDRKLKAFLSTYGNMYLDFSVGRTLYTIKKNFAETCYYLNEEEVKKTAFPDELEKIFKVKGKIGTSVKALFNIFARRYLPERSYYAGALTQQGQPTTNYYQMLYNLKLLGISSELIEKNRSISQRISDLKKVENELSKQKVEINESDLLDLQDELQHLIKDKENFVIAQNYDALKERADSLTQDMNAYRNELYQNDSEIRKKQRLLSASKSESIDISRVSQIYNEAKVHFNNEVKVQLEEVEKFHQKMQASRKSRLQSQIDSLSHTNQVIMSKLRDIEKQRDCLLRDLDSKGALEEYNSILDRIKTVELEISKLTSYNNVLAQFEKDKAQLELDKAQVKAEAIKYLEDNKQLTFKINNEFRQLVKRFYTDHGGSLQITNAKDAQYLYNIEPNIHKDGSQGINEVKIFCYDVLLFSLNKDLLGFLAHDSCIFNGVDPRQKAMMFKVVLELTEKLDLQYFVNINKDTYEQILNDDGLDSDNKVLTDSDKKQIRDNTVLKLFDSKPEHTLFGKTFG